MSGAVHTSPRCEGMAQNCAHYTGGCSQCRKPQHTKGPWRASGEHVFSVSGRLTVTRADYGTESERLANAQLIAAAPEMLAALEDLVNSFEKHRPKTYWDAARAAIAKAKGGSL